MSDSLSTSWPGMQSHLLLDQPTLSDIVQFSQAATATRALIRVRLLGTTDNVWSLPRCPLYSAMCFVIRSALRRVLRDAGNPDFELLNRKDLTILTKHSWPLVFGELDEVVIRILKPAPVPIKVATTSGEIIDLTGDDDDDTPRRNEVRIARAPSHIVSVDAAGDGDGEIEVALATRDVARSPSARPVVRVRGASILPHVRKKMQVVRRSMSRAVPTVKTSFKGFPKLQDHLTLEREWKRKRKHWVVVPKAKHGPAHLWLTDRNFDGEGLDTVDTAWLGRRRLRCVERDDRKLVDEGPDLYNLLVRAHGKQHLCTDKTWRRIRERYVGPSHNFVKRWIKELCPRCKTTYK
ncbi:hypothetical protein PENSPDRAFT_755084 [Peniophora sp. CONT]|nr:hypothetical protein PENSPDRAFT_755084 [Peniophora sp. CONT]